MRSEIFSLRCSSNKFFKVVIACGVQELREASGKAAVVGRFCETPIR
jgi:hypothetical protein